MLLKKSVASLKMQAVTTACAPHSLNVCTLPPAARPVWPGKLNRRTPQLEPAVRPSGSVCQPCVYDVGCGVSTGGADVSEREQRHGGARNRYIWHPKTSTCGQSCLQLQPLVHEAGRTCPAHPKLALAIYLCMCAIDQYNVPPVMWSRLPIVYSLFAFHQCFLLVSI